MPSIIFYLFTVCFKIFDADRDGILNNAEIANMVECMLEIKNQTIDEHSRIYPDVSEMVTQILNTKENIQTSDSINNLGDGDGNCSLLLNTVDKFLTIENYLVWTVENELPLEFSKFVHQICHIVMGLRPQSKMDEGDVVQGWLGREKRAPLLPGTIWYLIGNDWWTQWHAYVNSQPPNSPFGSLKRNKKAEQIENRLKISIPVDSSLHCTNNKAVIASSYTLIENDVLSPSKNHSLKVPDTTSSSSSRNSSRLSTPSNSPFTSRKYSSGIKYTQSHLPARPGPIDNSHLVQCSPKVTILTGEGGKLKSGTKIVQGRDFEIIPERLWKALFQWYGGAPSLPRQVIRNKKSEIELELRPLSIKILRHQSVHRSPASQGIGANTVSSMGYGGMTMHYSGGVLGPTSGGNTSNPSPKRYHAYQAGFSRRTNILQIEEFLSQRLNVKIEDMRMWFYRDDTNMKLLEER